MTLTAKPTADASRDPNNPDSRSRNESDHPYKSQEAGIRDVIIAILESYGIPPSTFRHTHGSQKTPDQAVVHEGHVAFGGLQHNGQKRYVGPGSGQPNPEPRFVMYRGCVQAGEGDQHNGDIVYVTGGGGKTSTTTTTYDSMICGSTKMSDNLPDGNREIKGTQHNGPIIKFGKKPDFE